MVPCLVGRYTPVERYRGMVASPLEHYTTVERYICELQCPVERYIPVERCSGMYAPMSSRALHTCRVLQWYAISSGALRYTPVERYTHRCHYREVERSLKSASVSH